MEHIESKVTQVADYYPFGMQIKQTSTDVKNPLANRYLYNGVEQDQHTENYEMPFRGYDPSLARFVQNDPLTDMIPSISGYHFGFNNPLRFNDPLGLFPSSDRWGRSTTVRDAAQDFMNNAMGTMGTGDGNRGNGTGQEDVHAVDKDGNTIYESDLAEVSISPFGTHTYVDGKLIGSKVDGYYLTVYQYENPKQSGGYTVDVGPFTGSMADGSTYFEGVRVHTTEVGAIGQGAAGTLPGVGIFVNPRDKYDVNLLRHEFGHILQARKWGNDFFYGTIVPVSLMSADAANNGSFDHQSTWTEWTANLLSWRYFGRPANWDMNNYPIYPVQHSGMLAYPPKSINLRD